MKKSVMFLAASIAVGAITPVVAHHSVVAYFDMKQDLVLKGEVDEWVFRAPHAVLKFVVKDDKGQLQLWRAETLPSNLLFRKGWRFNTLKKGDPVTVYGHPSLDTHRHAMVLSKVVLSDGRELNPMKKVDKPQ
ncbi:MAG TPA: DUF6152 family protein [Alphaproteobacteria bacterium]|nr:DUF6152 family protein [Alphaproteobacteria bacterium]